MLLTVQLSQIVPPPSPVFRCVRCVMCVRMEQRGSHWMDFHEI